MVIFLECGANNRSFNGKPKATISSSARSSHCSESIPVSRRIIGTAEAIRRVSEVANMFSQWYKLCVDNSWLADVWRFSVRDNGIGIAKGHQPRIFQIFERIGEKDTERL